MSGRTRWWQLGEGGQSLILLLVFSAVAITLTGALAVATVANLRADSAYTTGEQALYTAESGANNAVLRVVRDPGYAGETVALGAGTATISVSGTTTKTITADGVVGSSHRRVQVVVGVAGGNVVTVTSWSLVN
ncbi:MAG TPA: hypothetical protein VLF67_01555 [Candidatus Saccharimonas sp.]|nr:hypothetical protein [Candidatus Saccharimonas sp.]